MERVGGGAREDAVVAEPLEGSLVAAERMGRVAEPGVRIFLTPIPPSSPTVYIYHSLF